MINIGKIFINSKIIKILDYPSKTLTNENELN